MYKYGIRKTKTLKGSKKLFNLPETNTTKAVAGRWYKQQRKQEVQEQSAIL